jgi:glycosyltransferase involved in cell wall biosynthesis
VAGVAVILSPECNLPEVAEAGAGLVVEPQVEPLAAALRSLMTDDDRRREMGVHGRALVQERFTWERVAESLERVYQAFAKRM